jgi:uncharacterized membrane protein
MVEKLGGVVAMVASAVVMGGLSGLKLPIFITIPLVFVCVMIYLGGVVFLFAEGQIWTRDREGKRAPKVG